ncbi:putative plasmid transfer protein [Escherichia coli]|nr:putative plasmid transfer protein [Escherichia coli]
MTTGRWVWSHQNLIPRSIETKEVHGVTETFRIRPQVTTGVSWHNDMFTTALDVDLTPASGFTSEQQTSVCAVGAEFNAWEMGTVTYRLPPESGQQQRQVHSLPGLGSHRFDVIHIDVAGLVGTDNNYGAICLSYSSPSDYHAPGRPGLLT